MKSFQFDEVIVEQGSEASPIYRNLRRKLPDMPFRSIENIASAQGDASSVATALARRRKHFILPGTRAIF